MNPLVITKNFPTDPETVYDFITRPEHLKKWWGPENMTCPEFDLDLTQSGSWVTVMENKDGQKFKVSGVVQKISPPRYVEFTWAWHDEQDQRGHESVVSMSVEDDGKGGSIFTLTHSGLADEESAQNHNQGWTSSLRKLETMAH
ncbi:hypothetical protein BFP76_10270 [Amylibacter kogurei]|uniref:Activator of Hsp90 ATPase homologue 1/2-like C-terminal domain-containing protein n=1 Tax=Paramylibacter kogurei TaxID=1889778 RepID=A0A2G5K074_9RHOB|nr:SRPBCC domain-containing protein [Amylibacter kogurei]PIB22901.1 hypothetical protein BFP76_10270 [Amylibacter kogurei]